MTKAAAKPKYNDEAYAFAEAVIKMFQADYSL